MATENKTIKTSKFIKYTVNDEDLAEYSEDEQYIIDQDEKDIEEYNNMLYCTKMSLLQFVNDKSLPLCEYLTEKIIDKFIRNNIDN